MKKVLCTLFAVLLVFSLVLTGCSSQQNDDTDRPDDTNQTDKISNEDTGDKQDEKITLRLMNWDTEQEAKPTKELIESFMEENPNIIVQFEPTTQDYNTKLRTAIAAGNPPDVMNMDQWVTYYPMEPIAFEPLDDYLEKYDVDLDMYASSILQFWNYNGKQYGLPNDINGTAIYYNKKLFDEANLPYPEAGWTYDDMKELAQKLTKGSCANKVYGVFIPTDWSGWFEPLLWGLGGRVINDDLEYQNVLNSEETINAVDWITSFYREGLSPDSNTLKSMGGAIQMLKTGRVAMVLAGHFEINGLKSTEGFDLDSIGTVEFPTGPTGIKPACIFTSGYHISKDSSHKDEAFKLLMKIVGEEGQQLRAEYGHGQPAIPEIADRLTFSDDVLRLMQPFKDMWFKDGYTLNKMTMYYSPQFTDIETALITAIDKIILGEATPKEALDEAVETINAAIN